MKQFDFKGKAIDVRDCSDELKKNIDQLIATNIKGEAMNRKSWGSVECLFGDRKNTSWSDYQWAEDKDYTVIHYTDFLKAINPYEGMGLNVASVDEEVRQRMLDLGLTELFCPGQDKYTIKGGANTFWTCCHIHNTEPPTLTKEQFLNMEMPGEEVPVKKKVDGYIDYGGTIHLSNGEYNGDVRQAYRYNLLSEEDFKKKYPDKLKFAGYDVIVKRDEIKVGCQTVKKSDLNSFLRVYDTITGNSHTGSDLECVADAVKFMTKNKKALGLDL
jgi:hypothetical protein